MNGPALFMDAGFDQIKLGIAENHQWLAMVEYEGHVLDRFGDCLNQCFDKSGLLCKNLKSIYLLNGPGSTLGVRTICAFARTLTTLKQMVQETIYICNHLHFFQAYLTHIEHKPPPFQLCARANLTQSFTTIATVKHHLNNIAKINTSELPDASDTSVGWLPHPTLKSKNTLHYDLKKTLPLLYLKSPHIWMQNAQIDVCV